MQAFALFLLFFLLTPTYAALPYFVSAGPAICIQSTLVDIKYTFSFDTSIVCSSFFKDSTFQCSLSTCIWCYDSNTTCKAISNVNITSEAIYRNNSFLIPFSFFDQENDSCDFSLRITDTSHNLNYLPDSTWGTTSARPSNNNNIRFKLTTYLPKGFVTLGGHQVINQNDSFFASSMPLQPPDSFVDSCYSDSIRRCFIGKWRWFLTEQYGWTGSGTALVPQINGNRFLVIDSNWATYYYPDGTSLSVLFTPNRPDCKTISLSHPKPGATLFERYTIMGDYLAVINNGAYGKEPSPTLYEFYVRDSSINVSLVKSFNNDVNNRIRISPNPFNPSTTISYYVASPTTVTFDIFNISGKKVISLVNDKRPSGMHSVVFNAKQFSSGIYICVLKTNKTVSCKRMILVK